ncbi:membrane-associated proteins in eicosanoid and glutathione metabolism [Rhodotorula diobovata]|uniref:Glutathione S-transferase 3, mitochondrial n=1 Tax=Rhodotorula diobovata TaxID=5288 RepID=A0A5C5FUA9_9BASI|nr:membrane-associated proteins in eicosanoid and glutathione metabolism [Rhodotorula diobovata]
MSLLSAVLPADYPYVVAVGTVGVYSVLQYASINVSKARKAAGVKYPAPYAENAVAERDAKARIFNCAQRAHNNTLENLPIFLLALFHTGLYHPRYAAVGGAVWLAGRFAYIAGYSSGDPAKRQRGMFQYLGLLPLFLFSSYKAIASLPCFQ